MTVEWQSKSPHHTLFLHVEGKKDEVEAVCLALEAIGWGRETNPLPPVGETYEQTVSKPGNGIFNGWTPDEYDPNVKEVEEVMREQFEITGIPHYELGAAELL